MGKKLKYLKQYIYNTWGFLLTNYKGKKIYIFTHQRILSSNIHKYEKINMFHKKYLQIVIDNKDLFVTQHYIILDKNAKQNIILKNFFKYRIILSQTPVNSILTKISLSSMLNQVKSPKKTVPQNEYSYCVQ